MKKSVIAILHLGFWLCYLIIFLIILAVYNKTSSVETQQAIRMQNAALTLFFFALLPSIITFYMFYGMLFPHFLQRRRFGSSVLYGLLMSFGAALIGYILLQSAMKKGYIYDMDTKGTSTPAEVIIFMDFIALIAGIVALVLRGCITWFQEIKLKEELQQKNHETEMALIKAQLDPHFLFNTLNNIDVLILKDAVLASEYLNKLSDILRFMLYETKADDILLSKEVEYIEKYIELQKIRTSNLNYVSFKVTGSLGHKTVAPMVFIPFIENAFKHTTNKKIDQAIAIQINIKDDSIQFSCENKYSTHMQKESSGLGNELIRKRLHLMYPEKHSLEVNCQNELYTVRLTIKYA